MASTALGRREEADWPSDTLPRGPSKIVIKEYWTSGSAAWSTTEEQQEPKADPCGAKVGSPAHAAAAPAVRAPVGSAAVRRAATAAIPSGDANPGVAGPVCARRVIRLQRVGTDARGRIADARGVA